MAAFYTSLVRVSVFGLGDLSWATPIFSNNFLTANFTELNATRRN